MSSWRTRACESSLTRELLCTCWAQRWTLSQTGLSRPETALEGIATEDRLRLTVSAVPRSEFTFTNPNSKGECGCGESFTT